MDISAESATDGVSVDGRARYGRGPRPSRRQDAVRRLRSVALGQVLVEPVPLARLVAEFCEVGCALSCVDVEPGSEFEIAVLLVEVRGNRTVEPHDRMPANWRSSSYHSTIWTRSVSSTRGAPAWSAAIAACVGYSPNQLRSTGARSP